MKFWLREKLGLKQAEGRKAPRSFLEARAGAKFSGVFGGAFSSGKFVSVNRSVRSVNRSVRSLSSLLISLVPVFSMSSFLAFARFGEVSSDEGLALLLGSRILPRGGEVAVEEKSGGGKLSKSSATFDHGPLFPFSFIRRRKSDAPYLILELCLIVPFLYPKAMLLIAVRLGWRQCGT